MRLSILVSLFIILLSACGNQSIQSASTCSPSTYFTKACGGYLFGNSDGVFISPGWQSDSANACNEVYSGTLTNINSGCSVTIIDGKITK